MIHGEAGPVEGPTASLPTSRDCRFLDTRAALSQLQLPLLLLHLPLLRLRR